MESIAWTCGWFVTISVCSFIDANTRNVQGRKQPTESEKMGGGMACFIIWVVGLVLTLS